MNNPVEMWQALLARAPLAFAMSLVAAVLTACAVSFPPHRADIDLAAGASAYVGGLLIAGAVLRQLIRDFRFAAPGIVAIGTLLMAYLLAQAAPNDRNVLTFLVLVLSFIALPLLLVVFAVVLSGAAWLAGRLVTLVRRSTRQIGARVRAALVPRLPQRIQQALAAPTGPMPAIFPAVPADEDSESRVVVYAGVAFLTYGVLLAFRKRYLAF